MCNLHWYYTFCTGVTLFCTRVTHFCTPFSANQNRVIFSCNYVISSKISKSVNSIAKLKPHVAFQSLISIYYALVCPYLTYGCVLWGNNYEVPLSQLVRLQNKAVRIINNVPLCDHITPHYVNLGFIKLPDIIKLYTCQLFMIT